MSFILSKARREIAELQEKVSQELLNGGAANHADYKHLVGRYTALNDVIDIIERIVKQDEQRGLGGPQREG